MEVRWDGDLRFTGINERGVGVTIDTGVAYGGSGEYQTPMELLLVSLGGCAAIDLVMILEKMRVKVSKASVAIDARRRDQEPRYYKSINIVYTLGGEGLTREKAERAAKLATEKYCSVNVMLRDKVDITYEVRIELPDRRTAVSEAAGR